MGQQAQHKPVGAPLGALLITSDFDGLSRFEPTDNIDMDPQIQHRVDLLLLEQGEYLPLEFLLAEGRLLYSDYESWRGGELEILGERLFGDAAQIQKDLSRAAGYARALGLESTTLDYPPWGGGSRLRFSRNTILDSLFHKGYRKSEEQPQLDLFMDSAGTALANGIVLVLGRRDTGAAADLLEKLYHTDPGHPRLGGLERLLEALQRKDVPVTDPAQELTDLRDGILPLATKLLGQDCRPFLAPLWRRLGEALADQVFDPQHPELHRSCTALHTLDWESVIEAVEAESDWRSHSVLLQRHARASDQLQRPADGLLDRFELCWRFPEQAVPAQTDATPDLIRAWELFQELDPELETPLFPAWLLIIRPGLTGRLPRPDASAPADYRLLYALRREGQTLGAEAVRLRAELKELNPGLFRHFIANLSG